MRRHNVMRADLRDGVITVELAPDAVAPLPGDVPEPGGWKSPPFLDDPAQLYPRDPAFERAALQAAIDNRE